MAAEIEGVTLARLPVAPGAEALRPLLGLSERKDRGIGLLPA